MSRLGKRLLKYSSQVKVTFSDNVLSISGPKGDQSLIIDPSISVLINNDNSLEVQNVSEFKKNPKHGLHWSLIKNMIEGVTNGFEVVLELVGVGYRVQKTGDSLTFSLGFSHPVKVDPPSGVTFDVDGQTKVLIRGIDNQVVGQVAANIRKLRKPDAYKGKGVRYLGELVKTKAGKSVK